MQITVIGKVQGVFFRDGAKKKAIELGLVGWVRNSEDKVEMVAEGNEKRLDEFLEWCNKGPAGAEVEFVQIEWKDYTGEFKKFEIKY